MHTIRYIIIYIHNNIYTNNIIIILYIYTLVYILLSTIVKSLPPSQSSSSTFLVPSSTPFTPSSQVIHTSHLRLL